MSRPKKYKLIHSWNRADKPEMTYMSVVCPEMWSVKYEDELITLINTNEFRPKEHKYTRLILQSKKSAQHQADKLNYINNTNKYSIVKL